MSSNLFSLPRFICAGLLIVSPVVTSGQQWTGILDPSRATDWTQTGVTGGIPNRTNICATINPEPNTSASAPQSASVINQALMNCSNAGGGVVLLGPGTFYLSDQITFTPTFYNPVVQNVTLRGSGPDQTTLIFSGTGPCNQGSAAICIADSLATAAACTVIIGYDAVPSNNIANWTTGYAAGTTQITADTNAGNLALGQYIWLDQMDDPTSNMGTYGTFITGYSQYLNGGYVNTLGRGGGTPSAGRQMAERHKITGIIPSGGKYNLTITPPVAYTSFRTGQTPQVWWCGTPAQVPTGDGVENMTIDVPGGGAWGHVQFGGASQSWVKNVRFLDGGNAFISVIDSSNIEIRDNYFAQQMNSNTCGVAGTQYVINNALATFVKVENNILHQVCGGVLSQSCVACAFGYNYHVGGQSGTNNILEDFYEAHVGGTALVLIEGNEGSAINVDHASAHGTSASMFTFFRNRVPGIEPGRSPTNAVLHQSYQRLSNYVGNVLGSSGVHTIYEDSQGPNGNTSNYAASVYCIGYESKCTTLDLTNYDMFTLTSMLRWGNFDYATNAVRWCGNSSSPGWSTICNSRTEVPPDFTFVPSMTLPPSFYMNAKPTWWPANVAWPAIGPDVTTGTDLSKHAGDIPAKVCYQKMGGLADGSGGLLTFNANNCYGSATTVASVPAKPAGLTLR